MMTDVLVQIFEAAQTPVPQIIERTVVVEVDSPSIVVQPIEVEVVVGEPTVEVIQVITVPAESDVVVQVIEQAVSPQVSAGPEVVVQVQANLQGPAGPAGDDGAPGAQGPEGPAGSPDTAAQVLAKLATVDGTGSGLDADLLDGEHGAYYTDFAQALIDALRGLAPAGLDTLAEIAAAIGDDPNFAATIAADIALKANINSPALTGIPTAPTAAAGTNTTQIATMAAVQAAIALLVDSSPGTLDTLNELADALGNDPNFATTITTLIGTKANTTDVNAALATKLDSVSYTAADVLTKIKTVDGTASGLDADLLDGQHGSYYADISARLGYVPQDVASAWNTGNFDPATKADLASPAFTGVPLAPTAAQGTSNAQIANTNFVTIGLNTKAPLASPALTGVPSAPTAAPGTNTTQLATTAFVAALGALKANTASPTFTGVPAAPTAAAGTNTTQIATTAFVKAAIDLLIAAAPGALDTLNELAAALGDDPNFATTMTNALAGKVNTSSYTAADVLAKLLTVDGAGSGLDADLLDGQSSAYYTDIEARLGFTPANVAGQTFHGDLVTYRTASPTTGVLYLGEAANGHYVYFNGTDYVMPGGTLRVASNNAVWHNGNFNPATKQDVLGFTPFNPNVGGSVVGRTSFIVSGLGNNWASASLGQIEVRGAVGNDAMIAFHVGDFATYLGLDETDNKLKYGGWSNGSNVWEIWHEGNFTPSTKANVAGQTFTGPVVATTLAAGTTVAAGSSVHASTYFQTTLGVVYMNGAGSQYLQVSGSTFNFTGQTVYHSGNFGTKLEKTAQIELGQAGVGADRQAWMDFHTSAVAADYNARIIRQSATNGQWHFENGGTGAIIFYGSDINGFYYNDFRIYHTGNTNPVASTRLSFAGDYNYTPNTAAVHEPFAGSVMTGGRSAASALYIMRHRYMQHLLSGDGLWYTASY